MPLLGTSSTNVKFTSICNIQFFLRVKISWVIYLLVAERVVAVGVFLLAALLVLVFYDIKRLAVVVSI